MSYTVGMSGHITFSENTNMESVCETIFNSYSVSFYHDETIYGKYYIDIDSECITYRGDAFRTLLMTLCSNYSIEHGIIEVADSEKSWLFEYSKSNNTWVVKIIRKVSSGVLMRNGTSQCCSNCGFILNDNVNYCSNCGSVIKLTDAEIDLINRESLWND